jgi:RNA polymerase sigma factor (sigma-70 family)
MTTWPEELTELYGWLNAAVAKEAQRHGMNATAAEIVMTDALALAVAKWHECHTARKAWLKGSIIRSVIRDRKRADAEPDRPPLSFDTPVGADGEGGELTLGDTIANTVGGVYGGLTHGGTAAEANEAGRAMRTALVGLEPEYRRVLELKYLQGMGHRDIAAILNVPVSTVSTWADRGRKHLRRLVGQAEADMPETKAA